MELTVAERLDLHTKILEYIILNPGKLPDMIVPNIELRMHFRPISAIHNTGFIACETFHSDYDDDERREMFVEFDSQNPGNLNIKYSILVNKSDKSGYTELFNIAKAKITSYSYIIEDVIMNDYRDKAFLTSKEIDKIKVQIINVTTMLLLYAYQIRMQYGLLNIPEEIDNITIIDNFDEKPSESEENDEELPEKEYESLKDELKTELSTFVKKQYFQYKTYITSMVADLLEDTENKVRNDVSDTFHERFNKLETSNEKMSNDIESIKRDIWEFKRQMAEYTQTLFKKREVQMMDRIIEKLKEPDEEKEEVKPYNPIAEAVPVYGCPAAVPNDINLSSKDEETALKDFANVLKELCGNVDPKICVKVVKDRTKESNVDESVVFHCNCKDIFAKLTRISREMMAKASSTCHQGSEIAFQETINMRGDIDSDDFKKILNSTYARMCYITDYQRKCIEEGFRNSYHISCEIDSFLSGAVLYKFIVRDNLLYPKGMEVTFTFNDNHDLCVVENTLRGYDEFKNNLLTRYLMLGAKTDAWLFRELMNIGTDLRKRYEKEVERNGK